MLQKITQIVKNKFVFFNNAKRRKNGWHYLVVKKLALLKVC